MVWRVWRRLRMFDKAKVEPELGDLLFEAGEGVTIIGYGFDAESEAISASACATWRKPDVFAGPCVQKSVGDRRS